MSLHPKLPRRGGWIEPSQGRKGQPPQLPRLVDNSIWCKTLTKLKSLAWQRTLAVDFVSPYPGRSRYGWYGRNGSLRPSRTGRKTKTTAFFVGACHEEVSGGQHESTANQIEAQASLRKLPLPSGRVSFLEA